MTEITIVNTYDYPLPLAGVTARPGVPIVVDEGKYKSFAGTPAGKVWLRRGYIKIVGDAPAADEDETNDDAARDALITQLADLDVKADKRMSLETLQTKLDDATAPDTDDDGA